MFYEISTNIKFSLTSCSASQCVKKSQGDLGFSRYLVYSVGYYGLGEVYRSRPFNFLKMWVEQRCRWENNSRYDAIFLRSLDGAFTVMFNVSMLRLE